MQAEMRSKAGQSRTNFAMLIGLLMIVAGGLVWRDWYVDLDLLFRSGKFIPFDHLMFYKKTSLQQFGFAFLLGGGLMTALCGVFLRDGKNRS